MNHETLPAQGPVDVDVSRLLDDNKKLRHLLFMAHGSEEHYLYGDDGERWCNTCMIDFNNDSPDEIARKIEAYGMRKIARLQAEGKWPPEFLKTANDQKQRPGGGTPG